jgi:hypothetical protein
MGIGMRLHRGPSAGNRRRIIPGLRSILDSCSLSRAFVTAVEPITWSIMRLSPDHIPDPHSTEPAIFGVLKPRAKLPALSRAPAPRFESNSARYTLEYENPDLTRPSVSSF